MSNTLTPLVDQTEFIQQTLELNQCIDKLNKLTDDYANVQALHDTITSYGLGPDLATHLTPSVESFVSSFDIGSKDATLVELETTMENTFAQIKTDTIDMVKQAQTVIQYAQQQVSCCSVDELQTLSKIENPTSLKLFEEDTCVEQLITLPQMIVLLKDCVMEVGGAREELTALLDSFEGDYTLVPTKDTAACIEVGSSILELYTSDNITLMLAYVNRFTSKLSGKDIATVRRISNYTNSVVKLFLAAGVILDRIHFTLTTK